MATPSSLIARIDQDDVRTALARWQAVWSDECHHAGSDTHYSALEATQAFYRFGMSGTPLDRSDGADLRLLAQTGPVLYEVSNKLLVERGISVPPYVEMVRITDPKLPDEGLTWHQAHKLGVTDNEHLTREVVHHASKHIAEGRQVLVLVEQIKHGQTLLGRLHADGVPAAYITGKESTDARREVLDAFRAGHLRCLVATTILDEGVDVPCIDVLILAGGGKAKIRLLQRVGRGLRSGTGKERLLVVDFANFSHRWLLAHSLQRLRTYKAEECFMISAT